MKLVAVLVMSATVATAFLLGRALPPSTASAAPTVPSGRVILSFRDLAIAAGANMTCAYSRSNGSSGARGFLCYRTSGSRRGYLVFVSPNSVTVVKDRKLVYEKP